MYPLNQLQISDLLTRNPQIQTLITNALSSNQWPNGNQVCPTQDSWFGMIAGSPTAIGYNVQDDVYGTVLIACDASGVLNYTANTPVTTSVQNAAPYVSPTVPQANTPAGTCPGWSNIASVTDFLTCLGNLVTTTEGIVLIVVGYMVYKNLKS
jgi:hypothetical protein